MESDYKLFFNLFNVVPAENEIHFSMWLASVGLFFFSLSARLSSSLFPGILRSISSVAYTTQSTSPLNNSKLFSLLSLQVVLLASLSLFSVLGRSVLRSSAGAYAYDLPVLLQAANVYSLVSIYQYHLTRRSLVSAFLVFSSFTLVLVFAAIMRELSIFRGFYLSGIIIAFLSMVHVARGRVGYLLLIALIIFGQPSFADFGSNRRLSNQALIENIDLPVLTTPISEYWDFYSSDGDMNIFDTFTAASLSTPKFYPYLWSWIYVPLHFIPRSLWKNKPLAGTTQDVSFANGYPYSPGIIGFFLLDGGPVWMIFSMSLLGLILNFVDLYVLSLPNSVLKSCLVGIFVVNAMFLSRFFLWQYFSQSLYSLIPCIVLNRWISRSNRLFC
ncbi:MAG: hypothetical protein ACK55X_07390 [Synechococcaceae cyanobacterium]